MPLPDADKKSPRVYTLSQNTDLENMAFATLQSIGQPINIEELNEDELRRLVLVNLARLAVKGEWSGLLEAGGGSGYGVLMPETTVSSYDGYEIAAMAPWGHVRSATGNMNVPASPKAFPFVAPESGNLTEVEIWVNSVTTASTLVVAFYENAEADNVPGDLMGYVTIDTASSTGAVSQTSFSGGTPNLTEGTQYWCAYAKGTSGYASIKGLDEDNRAGLGLASSAINTNNSIGYGTVDFVSPNVPVDTIGTISEYNSGDTATIVIKY